MGIDVYARWKGQTEAERYAQVTGFQARGSVGYLREAYHGGPYATKVLCPEGWSHPTGIVIPAATLRGRLDRTVFTALLRHLLLYENKEEHPSVLDLDQDPVLAEAQLKAHMTRTRIEMQRAKDQMAFFESKVDQILLNTTAQRFASWKVLTPEFSDEALLPGYALEYVRFVELVEGKEKETHEAVRIHVSY